MGTSEMTLKALKHGAKVLESFSRHEFFKSYDNFLARIRVRRKLDAANSCDVLRLEDSSKQPTRKSLVSVCGHYDFSWKVSSWKVT